MEKRLALLTAVAALFSLVIQFSVLAAQNPTYKSTYYADAEILAEYGPSEVCIPYLEGSEGNWTAVENTYKFLMIDGTLEKDAKIFTEAGSTLVPVRLVSERLGANVVYKEDEKKIIIDKDDEEIVLFSGRKDAYANGERFELDVAVKNDGGTTYVPIRFIVENLGGKADYITYEGAETFPTVVVDSAEFLAMDRMSDEEVVAVAKETMLSAFDRLKEYVETDDNFQELRKEFNLEEIFVEIKDNIDNTILQGAYASCYVKVGNDSQTFIINTINGQMFWERHSTFTHILEPFEYISLGDGYFWG